MAGFLDKNERVMDVVLTSHGKLLLSQDDLRFTYWVPFDDEIDYAPVIHEDLSVEQLSELVQKQIEETPVREATTGYRRFNSSGSDFTNVFRPLYTMPQGQQVIPRMRVFEGPSGSFELTTKQQKVVDLHVQDDGSGATVQSLGPFDRGVMHFDPTTVSFELGYSQDAFPPGHRYEGFLIRVFESGSNGIREVGQRHDLRSDVCFNDDLKVFAAGVAARVG